MTSTSLSSNLPHFLFNGWQFPQHDISDAKAKGDLKDWNVSSLCSAYLKFQLDKREHEARANIPVSPPSLISISVGQILKTLSSSTDLQGDVKALAKDVDYTTLQHILHDPKTPYPILCLFDSLPSTTIKESSGDRKVVDIDEIVLAGEQHLRSKKPKNRSSYLVTLDDLSRILGSLDADEFITVRRKSPPKGGFEFLDQKRKPVLQIHGTDASFIKTFDRVTKGILKGLDWSHVFIAGGMVLNTLLHTDPSKDHHGDIY
ncbi:MAG: hypothetical protein Q9225_008100, partial [Loekoesia sp. 1 TL-2023]